MAWAACRQHEYKSYKENQEPAHSTALLKSCIAIMKQLTSGVLPAPNLRCRRIPGKQQAAQASQHRYLLSSSHSPDTPIHITLAPKSCILRRQRQNLCVEFESYLPIIKRPRACSLRCDRGFTMSNSDLISDGLLALTFVGIALLCSSLLALVLI